MWPELFAPFLDTKTPPEYDRRMDWFWIVVLVLGWAVLFWLTWNDPTFQAEIR